MGSASLLLLLYLPGPVLQVGWLFQPIASIQAGPAPRFSSHTQNNVTKIVCASAASGVQPEQGAKMACTIVVQP